MAYGYLYPTQRETLKRFVGKRVVHDLGAGDLELAEDLVRLGAQVIAVDEELPSPKVAGIKCVEKLFSEFHDPVETAFVSWPAKYNALGLVEILRNAETVIYLGNNFDGVCCGHADLWGHLRMRRVLALEPQPKNTLIVYGEVLLQPRPLLPEEQAAIDLTRIYRFEDHWHNNREKQNA